MNKIIDGVKYTETDKFKLLDHAICVRCRSKDTECMSIEGIEVVYFCHDCKEYSCVEICFLSDAKQKVVNEMMS